MKKTIQIWVSIICCWQIAVSQTKVSDVVSRGIVFLKDGNYNAANIFLDSVIKVDANNVDAWMMKGNLVLNRASEFLPPSKLIPYNAGNIFSQKPEPLVGKIIPADTVFEIEKYWRKCLSIDSSRNDIRKGLCTLYGMALMKDKLKKEIVAVIKNEKDADEEFPYKLADYARKFKERNAFEDGIDVYKFIASLYPALAGLRCDIAGEYFFQGYMNESLIWLDSCYNFKTVDETSFLNGAFLYSELGYFDDAQNVLNKYSNIYNRKMDKFYFGLRLFADTSNKYADELTEFINSVDTASYYTEVSLSKKLISFKSNFRFEDFKQLASDKDLPEYYKVLILTRAVKQFADSCEPYLVYGVFQATIKNYGAAVQFLEQGERCEMPNQQKEYWQLVYGYTLFKLGEYDKALSYFSLLYNSQNTFYKHAAKYFSVPALQGEGRGDVVKKLLNEIVTDTQKTKYGDLIIRIAGGTK
jgi:tetratricopeptide (TPR) repeat protein